MAKGKWLELAYWTQKKAQLFGAQESSISINQSRRVEVDYRDEKIEKMKESSQQGLSIEIFSKGRYSSHSTNDLRKESLEKFIQNAVDLTRYLEVDEYRGLTDPTLYEGQSDADLDLFDPEYDGLTTKTRKEVAMNLGAHLLGQDDRIISVASGFSDNSGETYVVKSNGFEGTRKATSFSQYVEVSIQGEGDRKPQNWRYYSARHLADLPSTKQTAMEALERTRSQLGQAKVKTDAMPMIVENSNASGLLRRLSRPLSGASIQQKNSFLDGKKGKKIASKELTITDEPTIVRGLGSRLYDGDGIAAKKMYVIQDGVLKNYYIDVYYGRKLGWTPTTGYASNIVIKPGKRSAKAIEKDLDKGILVTNWLGGNANGTTGDFSLGVAGWLIENGQRTQPIGEMNISGNYTDLLMNLKEVGNDPYPYSSFRTPTLIFNDVKFSGT